MSLVVDRGSSDNKLVYCDGNGSQGGLNSVEGPTFNDRPEESRTRGGERMFRKCASNAATSRGVRWSKINIGTPAVSKQKDFFVRFYRFEREAGDKQDSVTISVGDSRPIANIFKHHAYNSPNGSVRGLTNRTAPVTVKRPVDSVLAGVVTDDRRSCRVLTAGSGVFLPACVPHRFLPATPSSDHGNQIPTTEGAGRCPLLAEYGHRCPEPRKGALKRHPRQSCLWHRHHPSHHDQGTFSPLP